MAFHPRENWDPLTRRRLYSRREFMWRAGALGVSLSSMSAILAACGGGDSDTASEVVIGTPSSPVTQPVYDDNVAIESGLPAESGTLRIYNWADYINPELIPVAAEALGVEIEVSTFFNEEEALQKLLSGEVNFDVFFPVGASIPKVVAAKLVQPLNHDYLPNLANVWPQLADPFYDQGSQYSVPYTVYQTGIAWRTDMVDSADVEGLDNPWDVFWNPDYSGVTGLYDDFRETLSMVLMRAGVEDPKNATPEEIEAAGRSLVELVDLMNIRYTIDGVYSGIPEGRFGLHLSWSGDVVASPFYWAEGDDPSITRYLWPARAAGSTRAHIANDTLTVLRGAEHPVLAHQFIDFMLSEDNALENFGWNGYQPPQTGLDVSLLVEDEWVAPYLETAVVLPEDFDNERGVVPTQLPAEQEARFNDAWSVAKAGG